MAHHQARRLHLPVRAGRPSSRGRRPLLRRFRDLGPGVSTSARENPHCHSALGSRDLETRTGSTAAARRQENTLEVQDHASPQGTRNETREVFQHGRRVHQRSRCPIGVGVGQTHCGRRRDRRRRVLRRRWDPCRPRGPRHLVLFHISINMSCPLLLTRFLGTKLRVIVGDHSTIQIQDISDGTPSSIICTKSFILLSSPTLVYTTRYCSITGDHS